MDEVVENENYPSNSMKNRDEVTKPSDKKSKKVISGPVTQKKKNIAQSFTQTIFGNDANSVLSYILYDVLIPAAKSTISEMVSSGIEMLLFGETRGSGSKRDRDRNKSYVSYTSYYDRGRERDREPRYSQPRRQKYEELIFHRASDADQVLDTLLESIDKYGSVSLTDLYDAVGWDSEFTDDKYGWKNLGRARVERTREGYILSLPRPIDLD